MFLPVRFNPKLVRPSLYLNLSDADFDIESVPEDFDIAGILPSDYGTTAAEPIPAGKIKAQLRATTAQLESVIERKKTAAAG